MVALAAVEITAQAARLLLVGGCGEGGAFVSKHPAVMDQAQLLRVHGSPKRYTHTEVGFNFRMDGFQGAVLNIKLKKLAGWTARRRAIAAMYRAGIKRSDVQLPVAHVRDQVASAIDLIVHVARSSTGRREAPPIRRKYSP